MIKNLQWTYLLSVCALSFALIGTSFSKDTLDESTPEQNIDTGRKIKVVEVFWYGCSRCYSFERHVEKWLTEKEDYIEFVRIPGALGKNWLPHARAYYVAEKLGVLEKIHRPLFDAIHEEKRKILDKESLRDFFAEYCVDEGQVDELYHSKEVGLDVKRSYAFGQRYGIRGVPAIIINGKYGTSASVAGGYDKLIDVINKVAAKEYEEYGKTEIPDRDTTIYWEQH